MDCEYKNFKLEIDPDGVAVLTANRPEKLNAMDALAWEELYRFFTAAAVDECIRGIILTGAGDKAFIAGADVAALRTKTPANTLTSPAPLATAAIEACGKPVVAAVNGYAFGGGCEIALACDIRVISENAMFALPEIGLGVISGAGGTQRLARLIGMGRAKEVILMGRKLKAEEAVSFGLAYRCVAQAHLMEEAYKAVEKMLSKGPVAFQLSKKLIHASMSTDQMSGMMLEQLSLAVACGTEDKNEGVDAFLEKRAPAFSGK